MLRSERQAGRHKSMFRALIVVGAKVLLPSAAFAATCTGFRPARLDIRDLPDLKTPVAVLSADFNGDGVSDLAVVNRDTDASFLAGSVWVMTGDGRGGFTLASTQLMDGSATSAATGEFNGDALTDLVVVNKSANEALIFLGDGTGGFQPHVPIPAGSDPIHVSVADMNADGNVDLVVVQQSIGQPSGRVMVMRGDGSGGFTSMTPASIGQDPRGGAATGDFNGDGRLDVVAGTSSTGDITFLPGLGDGNFGTPLKTTIGVTSLFFAGMHLDDDGKLDLVVTSETFGTSVLALRGIGDGTFSVISTWSGSDGPGNPILCDFTQDGRLDVGVPMFRADSVWVLPADGAGGLMGPLIVDTGPGPWRAAAGDVNADGLCDILTADSASDRLSVMTGVRGGLPGTPSRPLGDQPIGSVLLDFDRDGHLDLAAVNRLSNTVSVLRGDGEGGLSAWSTIPVGAKPGSIAGGDFNLDAAWDLVVANQGEPGDPTNDVVNILLNDGAGGFVLADNLMAGDLPLDIKAGDFNKDGRLDVAVANSRSDRVSFFFGQPSGGFGAPKSVNVGDPQRSLAVADFNGDGLLDVAASLNLQNAVVVLLGTSAPAGFTKGPVTVIPGTAVVDQIATGDLNADGLADLVAISKPSNPQAAGELTVLRGAGTGSFELPFAPVPMGRLSEAVVLVDLDRDGDLDAAVAEGPDNDILVLRGDGSGRLDPGERFGVGSDTFSIAAGDLNEDLRIDLAVTNGVADSVSILLNNTAGADPVTDLAFSDHERMVWSGVPGATSYRIYRDLLNALAPDAYGQCLGGSTTMQFIDPAVPPASDGYFYLVTAVIAGQETPLGFTSDCMKRHNSAPCSVP